MARASVMSARACMNCAITSKVDERFSYQTMAEEEALVDTAAAAASVHENSAKTLSTDDANADESKKPAIDNSKCVFCLSFDSYRLSFADLNATFALTCVCRDVEISVYLNWREHNISASNLSDRIFVFRLHTMPSSAIAGIYFAGSVYTQ